MITTDRPEYLPSIPEIVDAFHEEITSLGGAATDVFSDDRQLFARAVLAADAEIRPGDTIRAGVAIAARSSSIQVCAYTYRLVCSNGAIAAHVRSSRRVSRIRSTSVLRPEYDIAVTLANLQAAVRENAAPEQFTVAVEEMQAAWEIDAAMAMNALPMLLEASLPAHVVMRELSHILYRFDEDDDRSLFGLMNAVTSVARDHRDQRTRWRLEEVGGGLPAQFGLRFVTAGLVMTASR